MLKNILINKMMSNNVHLGHKKNKLHYSMKNYVININKKIHIINLEITIKALYVVKNILKDVRKFNKKLLFICIEKKTKKIIKLLAKSVNMPYVNKRWLGGSLTNFKTLKNSIENMNYLKSILKNKNFIMKKKKERLFKKKLKRKKSFLNGLIGLRKLPEYVFIINLKKHKNVLKETKKMNITSIAVIDSDNSTKNVDYIIPGNDDSYKSILFFLKKIVSFIINKE